MKTVVPYLICLFLILVSCQNQNVNSNSEKVINLEAGFKTPPNQAKPRTWWHWISGNVSKSGITKDLEAMKSVCIQEAQLFNVHLGFPKAFMKYYKLT